MKIRMKLGQLLPAMSDERADSIIAVVRNRAKELSIEPEEIEVKRASQILGDLDLVEGDRASVQFISTRNMDRDNEILLPKGVDLSQFELAPQVLAGHNHAMPPIGKASGITVDDFGVKAKVEFAPTERGEEFWQLVKGGFLKTWSVGFVPLDVVDKSHAEWAKEVGKATQFPEFMNTRDKVERFIRKWMLLEFSAVSVPSNINALTTAVAKGELILSQETQKSLGLELKEKEAPEAAKSDEDAIEQALEGEPIESQGAEIKSDIESPEIKKPRVIEIVEQPRKRIVEVVEPFSKELIGVAVREKLDLLRGKV